MPLRRRAGRPPAVERPEGQDHRGDQHRPLDQGHDPLGHRSGPDRAQHRRQHRHQPQRHRDEQHQRQGDPHRGDVELQDVAVLALIVDGVERQHQRAGAAGRSPQRHHRAQGRAPAGGRLGRRREAGQLLAHDVLGLVRQHADQPLHQSLHLRRVGDQGIEGDQRRQPRRHRQHQVEGDAARRDSQIVRADIEPHALQDAPPAAPGDRPGPARVAADVGHRPCPHRLRPSARGLTCPAGEPAAARSAMPREIDPQDARQGRRVLGRRSLPVFLVLLVLAILVVALLG